ncbi:MAG: segregation/condensation protein A [Clostridia bacterium]|nr:segregation/condensation protein A [Clostridia bacterium]
MTVDKPETILEEDYTGLKVQLNNFSGPLDLLLHLVKENEIEIKDIFVSEVTEQFLQYMTDLDSVDVNKAAEYMAMAATLIEIKSHALLPKFDDLDEEDSAEKNLIRQLEEYKMFKEVVAELKVQENVNRYYREPVQPKPKDVLVVQEGFDMNGFMEAINKFLLKMQARALEPKTSQAITKDTYTVKDRVSCIVDRLKDTPTFMFFEMFDEQSTKAQIVTTFIALLEMLKLQFVSVEQLLDDIKISLKCDVSQLTEDISYDSLD